MHVCTVPARRIGIAAFAILTAALMQSAAMAADPSRPHKGSCSTIVTPVSAPGVFPQQLRIDSDCRLTHLGRTTGQTIQTVALAGPPSTTIPLNIVNVTTYQAANGDQLYMLFTGSGQLDPGTGNVTFYGTETYNGGTGRFAGATGSASVDGSASIFTNLGTFTLQGRIAY
jgi:hypothetical protein